MSNSSVSSSPKSPSFLKDLPFGKTEMKRSWEGKGRGKGVQGLSDKTPQGGLEPTLSGALCNPHRGSGSNHPHLPEIGIRESLALILSGNSPNESQNNSPRDFQDGSSESTLLLNNATGEGRSETPNKETSCPENNERSYAPVPRDWGNLNSPGRIGAGEQASPTEDPQGPAEARVDPPATAPQ